ncbi:hypothetical protein OROGR_006961 [Orobanche gracilis]
MSVDQQVVKFNIDEAMKLPEDACSLFALSVIDPLVEEVFELDCRKKLEEDVFDIMEKSSTLLTKNAVRKHTTNFIKLIEQHKKIPPSTEQAPELELKPLPEHLKYVYLGKNETLPVIISAELTPVQEKALIAVLERYKEAIGWTIADIRGISPAICMHRILLVEDAKPSREAQRRLNPPMMDVVKKEVLKLLDVGMIYPISDSKWVSPTQVVP